MRRYWTVLVFSICPLFAEDSAEEIDASPPIAVALEIVDAPEVVDTPPLASFYAEATVATAKTSIYIGAVTLTMPPFAREGDVYRSTYTAKVFPLFFYNESGRISITLSDDDLRQLASGQRVYFKGEAFSSKDEPRRVEGHADPADETSGKIKVRVWVSKNIELIFNTTYRFTGKPPTAEVEKADPATPASP